MHLVFLLKQSVSGPLFPPQSFVGCWLAHVLARASLADVAAMLLRSILAVLVLPHATYAHSPPQPSLSPPRSGQPTLKASGKEEATKRTALLAQAKPAAPANRVTDIAAGTYSGLVAGFLNCVVVASIVFEPIGLPLSIAVQHALTGFVITQLVVTKLTGVGALLTVPSFEALPFMARYAVLVSNALGPDQMPSVLATVLAGCLAVSHPTSRALWLQPGMIGLQPGIIGLQDRRVAAWNHRVAARAPMVADEPARLCDARRGLGLAGERGGEAAAPGAASRPLRRDRLVALPSLLRHARPQLWRRPAHARGGAAMGAG